LVKDDGYHPIFLDQFCTTFRYIEYHYNEKRGYHNRRSVKISLLANVHNILIGDDHRIMKATVLLTNQ
jgi:hypothetical protein